MSTLHRPLGLILYGCVLDLPGPKGKHIEGCRSRIHDQPGEAMKNSAQHTLDEFQKSAAFLGANITLAQPVAAGPVTALLPGLLPAEVSCLSRRQDEVLTLIDGLRLGNALNTGTGGCPGSGRSMRRVQRTTEEKG